MEHHTTTSRAEAERLLGISEKLLRTKDLGGSRDFAILAQETEPLLEGSDQILAVAEVLLAADKKIPYSNNQHDWYSVLQIPQRTNDSELIKKQYRRLALLLHPDKNKYAFADSAFRLVADAWAVLSDPAKKALYDSESAARFEKVDLVKKQFGKKDSSNINRKLPVRRSGNNGPSPAVKVNENKNSNMGNFWTPCPYCYNLYEYPRGYEGCCLRCENEKCRKAFTAAEISSMPPLVPGKEAYYCVWGVFPMGFRAEGGDGFPKWMPPMFGNVAVAEDGGVPPPPPPPPAPPANLTPLAAPLNVGSTEKKKRGRPRKQL